MKDENYDGLVVSVLENDCGWEIWVTREEESDNNILKILSD